MTTAEAVEREIIAEIGRLGVAEIERVKAWVAAGCEGPQPRPDDEARREQTDRLALLFAGQCDPRVEAALADFRARVLEGFAGLFDQADPENLAAVADSIVEEIRARRREMETAGAAQQSATAC